MPAENLLGKEGEGFIDAMRVLDGGRISIAALALGIARGALDAAVGYVKERRQFGKSIAEFQGIQWKLADMASWIEAARLLTYRAAWLKDQRREGRSTASSIAKLYASEIAVRVAEEGVGVEVAAPASSVWAMADPGAVARIVRILVDNALRFTPNGTPVRVSLAASNGKAAIAVADAGPGVPDAEREMIFERFQRGSATGGEGGFGLGLSLCKRITEAHGGSIRLESAGEKGTVARITLPKSAAG